MGRLHIALVSAAVLVTVGCTNGNTGSGPLRSSDDAGRPTADGGTDGSEQGGPPTIEADGREMVLTPLMAFWSGVGGPPDPDEVEVRRMMRELEEHVATCMRAQGFEYIPQEPQFTLTAPPRDDRPWDLPPDEFAARYGYGITTIDGREWVLDVPEDPNDAIVAAMSDAEREAYYEAMWGPGVRVIDSGRGLVIMADVERGSEPGVEWGSEPGVERGSEPRVERGSEPGTGEGEPAAWSGGCQQEANGAVFGHPMDEGAAGDVWNTDEFRPLLEEMGSLHDRVDRDPRVTAAVRDWAGCMADAGHPGFAHPDEAQTTVQARVDEVAGSDGQQRLEGLSASDLAQELNEALDTDDVAGLVFDDTSDRLAALDPADLQALRDYEIAVAVADHHCRQDYDEVRTEVQIAVEQAFLDANRDELERFRDRTGGVG